MLILQFGRQRVRVTVSVLLAAFVLRMLLFAAVLAMNPADSSRRIRVSTGRSPRTWSNTAPTACRTRLRSCRITNVRRCIPYSSPPFVVSASMRQ